MLLIEQEARDGGGGGDEGRSDDLEALVVVGLRFLLCVGFFGSGEKKGRSNAAAKKNFPLSFHLSFPPAPLSLFRARALSKKTKSHQIEVRRSIFLTSSAARVSWAAFCTFFPALVAAALASAAAAAAFFETASLAARAAALASRGEEEPAGAAAVEEVRAEADDEEAEAPALGVVAAERSAGVEARDERGVNDFLRDSPSFLEKLRFSSARAAESDIFLEVTRGERRVARMKRGWEKERSVCFLFRVFVLEKKKKKRERVRDMENRNSLAVREARVR